MIFPPHKHKSKPVYSPIQAIIKLAIQNTIHSKIIPWLLVTIISITTLLPFLLQGDGSPVDEMKLIISYPFSISFIVLILGSVWISSGMISLEISSREIQSVIVKPISPFKIVLAKWLALLIINSALVIIMGLGLLLSVSIATNSTKHKNRDIRNIRNEILTCRTAVKVDPIDNIEEKAEMLRWRLISQKVIPQNTTTAKICGQIQAARSTVAPGKTNTWTITLSKREQEKAKTSHLALRYKYNCNPTERIPISGTWIIESENTPPVKIPVFNKLDGSHVLNMPKDFKPNGGFINISFHNQYPKKSELSSSTTDNPKQVSQDESVQKQPYLYFAADNPVELLIYQSSFTMNFIRSMLAILCFLACISAIGLCMSTLFSFPVAILSTSAIIFAVTIASSFSEKQVEHHHGPKQPPAKIIQLTEPILIFVKHSTKNITKNIPVSYIADGMMFSWMQMLECIVLLLLFIPGVLILLSSLILSQKELAI